MAITFEGYERRIAQINKACEQYGIKDLEEALKLCTDRGFNPYDITTGIQSIAFENAKWAYTLGCAIALKKAEKGEVTTASEAAAAIGEGLQAFCVPGSVADDRKVGLGHGNLGAMLLGEDTECFAFLAGHESFAAAEGAIGIANNANKARKKPLRVILNGLGKDAAQIIARINGFTYVKTQFDYYTSELKIVETIPYSDGPRAKVNCYGADDVREGVAIMWHENVDILDHRQLHQPHALPAPRRGHLLQGARACRQEVLLRGVGRRHRPYPAPGQHGCRPRLLRHDRHHGPHALQRAVRRLQLRACARRHDGSHRHGQQPHGWLHRCVRRRRRGVPQEVGSRLSASSPRRLCDMSGTVTPGWRSRFFVDGVLSR